MLRKLLFFFLILFVGFSCKYENDKRNTEKSVHDESQIAKKKITKSKYFPLTWDSSHIETLSIDSNLSYSNGFKADSVVAVDYIGFEGEHSFYPINEKGEWINTIINRKTLTQSQANSFQKILGNNQTYRNPNIVGCYQPRLGLIYFKKEAVIAQTQICLTCAGLRSTAKTGISANQYLFNRKAEVEMDKIRKELSFTETDSWYKL